VTSLVVVVVVIVIERFTERTIREYMKKRRLEPHLENGFKLLTRTILFVIGLLVILQLFGLSADWLVSMSALTGAAIGFASTQTLGNFLAGVYLMLSRPFLVNDYVKIGDVEGQVREITVNYTKIYNPTYNYVEMPNRSVLDSKIQNFSKENVIDYTFEIGFPHGIPSRVLLEECISPALDEVYAKYKDILSRGEDGRVLQLPTRNRRSDRRQMGSTEKRDDLENARRFCGV
jgi:small-conductance mechanosensitive channel